MTSTVIGEVSGSDPLPTKEVMKIIRIPLAVAAVFSLGVVGVAPAFAEGGHVHRPPQQHVAKGRSAPGATTRRRWPPGTTTSPRHSSCRARTTRSAVPRLAQRQSLVEQYRRRPVQRGHNSIWYRWTASATGHVIFRTIGSNYDTVMRSIPAGSWRAGDGREPHAGRRKRRPGTGQRRPRPARSGSTSWRGSRTSSPWTGSVRRSGT